MAAGFSGVRRSRAEWQSLIERAHRSPLSVTAFCAAQGASSVGWGEARTPAWLGGNAGVRKLTPAYGGGWLYERLVNGVSVLAGSPIVSVQGRRMGEAPGVAVTEDKAAFILGFADGSFGTIHYLANGAASFPKERLVVFAAGRVLQLDSFRKLRAFGWPGFKGISLWRQDKGQGACAAPFLAAIADGKPSPIAPGEIFEVARATIEATEQRRAQR